MNTRTTVEILDRTLAKIAEVKALYPLNRSGTVLRYSRELSDFGHCIFRIRPQDPLFATYGDIIEPHRYHIRLRRGGTVVWQGAIIDNPRRTHTFIEVKAAEYLFYLGRKLVRRTSAVSYGGTAPSTDIGLHYRIFASGIMSSAVSSIITEAKEAFGTNHVLNGLALSTIENPLFPKNFSTSNGTALTGDWTFSENVVLQFDYQSVLYVLKAFGIYASADFRITNDLEFEFKRFLGNKNSGVTFTYGPQGNTVDYDIPRLGGRMANSLVGIATDPRGVVLHAERSDSDSLQAYGLLEDPASFADVKDKNALGARMAEQLRLSSKPDSAPLNFLLSQRAELYGSFDVGDIITARIQDYAIDYKAPRRVVGMTVNVHDTGTELITVQTNRPRDEDIGG